MWCAWGVSVSAPRDAAGDCLEVQTDLDQANILAVILWNIETMADDMAVIIICPFQSTEVKGG